MQEDSRDQPRYGPWVGKIPWRRECLPNPVFLPGEFHGQRSLVGNSPWDRKESDTTDRLTLTYWVRWSPWSPAPLWVSLLFCFHAPFAQTSHSQPTCFSFSSFPVKCSIVGASLVVQWLRIRLPVQRCRFDPWSGNEDPTCLEATSLRAVTAEPAHTITRESA